MPDTHNAEKRGYLDAIDGRNRARFNYVSQEVYYSLGYEKGLEDRVDKAYGEFTKGILVQLELFSVS